MKLEEMSWPEIEAGLLRTKTVILPVGATEEHGPHLPVFTDTIQAVRVAEAVAERRDIFVAPPLHYGVCRSTRWFPGTITVSHDALRNFAKDLLLSFHDSGFQDIMVLTGHAGGQHMAALEEACQMAVEERDIQVSLVLIIRSDRSQGSGDSRRWPLWGDRDIPHDENPRRSGVRQA